MLLFNFPSVIQDERAIYNILEYYFPTRKRKKRKEIQKTEIIQNKKKKKKEKKEKGFIATCVITEEKRGRSERRNKRGKGKHYRDKYRNEGSKQKVKKKEKGRKKEEGGRIIANGEKRKIRIFHCGCKMSRGEPSVAFMVERSLVGQS